jgi:hypothetical protein
MRFVLEDAKEESLKPAETGDPLALCGGACGQVDRIEQGHALPVRLQRLVAA